MGRDKAGLEWEEVPMARRVVDALSVCVERVRLVTRPGSAAPLPLECIEDAYPVRAPLVGIHAALTACETSAVLIAACDLPKIDPRVVLALLALVPASDGHDIVAPVGPSGPEPLLAVYRPTLLPEVTRRIETGELALRPLVRHARSVLVPQADLRALDPKLDSFRNVNVAQDLR